MELSVSIDAKAVTDRLAVIRNDQVPFAMANAINATAQQFQRVELAHIHQAFTLRRASWIDQSVKITHFAKKTELWATIGIHPPGGDQRADVLTKFEDQTLKLPFKGSAVAIPTAFVRRNKSDIIPKNMFPGALGLHNVGNRVLGDQRTFLITTKGGQHIILQRIGKGARSITAAIWHFAPSARITPDLDFESNAVAVVDAGWAANFVAAYEAAMQDAR